MTDCTIEIHESLFHFRPVTDVGRTWLEQSTNGQWLFDGALVVEPRYALALADRMIAEGLEVDDRECYEPEEVCNGLLS